MSAPHPLSTVTLAVVLAPLFALAALLVTWLAVRGTPAPGASSEGSLPPDERTAPPVAGAPTLAAAPARPATPPAARRFEVEVVDAAGSPVAGARVHANAVLEASGLESRARPSVETGADGRATVDLVEIGRLPLVASVHVVVDAPAHLLATEEVPLPLGDDGRPPPTFVLSRRFVLVAARVLEGLVADREGRPVASALVWVHEVNEDDEADADLARTDAQGAYAVRMRSLVPVDVVAHAEGFSPARVRAAGGRTGRERLDTIVLDRGVALAGRIVAGPDAPRGRALVIATACGAWAREEGRTLHAEVALTSTAAGCFLEYTSATAGADGRFRVEGLGTTAYRLRAAAEDFGCATHPDAADAVARVVSAPADDVVLDVGRARLQVQALDGDAPIPNALVTVEGETGRLVLFSGTDTIAGAAVRAGRRYLVRVEAAGRASVERSVVAPADGQTHLERVAMGPRADGDEIPSRPPWDARPASLLRLQVRGPDDAPVPAPLRLTGPDGAEIPLRLAVDGRVASAEREGRIPADGWAVLLTPVRAGPHTLEVLDGAWEPVATTFDVAPWKPGDKPRSVVVRLTAR